MRNLDHEWLLKFLEHEIADRRILRLIQKWLKAGVSEDGEWSETKKGTPKVATGRVIVVRYADNFVLGFEHRADAERFLEELRECLGRLGSNGIRARRG